MRRQTREIGEIGVPIVCTSKIRMQKLLKLKKFKVGGKTQSKAKRRRKRATKNERRISNQKEKEEKM